MKRKTKNNTYIKQNDYTILRITSKKYGIFDFMIDNQDYDMIKHYSWCISKCTNKKTSSHINFYATAGMYNEDKTKYKYQLLHRFIMNAPKGMIVDHVDGNTFNTRRNNLRLCTFSQNKMNGINMYSNNTSGFVGVTWVEKQGQWMAYLKVNNKFKNLGYYDFIEDALEARLKGEEKYHKEFANKINQNIV